MSSSAPSVSMCIRTRDRLDALERLLNSIRDLDGRPSEVLVSDDSPTASARPLIERFPAVVYIEGPRRGLAANANWVVGHASSDFVLMLDDDVVLSHDFLDKLLGCAQQRVPRLQAESRVIVTCPVLEPDLGLIEPHDQDFLGFQKRPYDPGRRVRTFVQPAVLLPRAVFDELEYDEQLPVYEEVDFATRASKRGYEIVICPPAVTEHFPSRSNSPRYGPEFDAARIYVTLKRYAFTDRKPLKSLGFALYAPLHLIGGSVKRLRLAGVAYAFRALRLATRYLATYLRRRARRS